MGLSKVDQTMDGAFRATEAACADGHHAQQTASWREKKSTSRVDLFFIGEVKHLGKGEVSWLPKSNG